MNLGLFEDNGFQRLLPLTYLRSAFELRCGRDRLMDKVAARMGMRPSRMWLRAEIENVVAERVKCVPASSGDDWCLLNARAFVTDNIDPPAAGVAWVRDGELAAVGLAEGAIPGDLAELVRSEEKLAHWLEDYDVQEPPDAVRLIRYPWELVLANGEELRRQCTFGGVHEGKIYPGAHMLQPGEIHVAADAIVKPGAVLDAEDGPIHIDREAVISPNCVIQGPCYIGPKSIIQPGAAIRHDTSIGPVCKVGGEVEASIVHSHSNKQHDGFLGHSYVSQWVNLGADTVTSDLKNTYGTIRVSINGVAVESGEKFVGSIIGDHAKTGIGTILPTGCVIGLAANVFVQSRVPQFVPSYSWLTDDGLQAYRLGKALEVARTVMARRGIVLSDAEAELLAAAAKQAGELETGSPL